MRIMDWSSDVCSSDPPAVVQPDLVAEARAQRRRAVLVGGEIRFLALLDQRTHPIGLPVRGDMPAERLDNIAEPILRDHARLDRLASDRKSTRLNSSH